MVERFFEKTRPYFESGGRYRRWYPLYEAIETIFLSPGTVTVNSPHVRDSLDVKRFMTIVIMTLIPLLLFGIYNSGYQSRLAAGLHLDFFSVFLSGMWIVLPLVLVSYGVGFAWEILFAVVRKHPISEGLFVTAMLFPLTLPPTIPLWQAALGISFGIVIGKEIFGGTGRNFLNPALTGRAFLFFAYPAQMSGDRVWIAVKGATEGAVDAISSATPLAIAALSESSIRVEQTLIDAGYSFSRLFFGLYPDSIGASSVLLCAVAAVILVALGIANYRIIAGDILGVLAVGFFLNLLAGTSTSPYLALNPFYHLVIGGTAFGFTFMSTDPVSAPDMNAAKWVYGFAIGSLTVLIRVFNPAFPEGVMLAILFMNVLAPMIDHLVLRFHLGKRIANV